MPILAPGEDLDADSDDELRGMGQGVGAMDFTETDLAGAEAGDAAPSAPGAQGAGRAGPVAFDVMDEAG